MLDDEAIPERLMARYPPAEITAAQFEQFAVELLTAGESGQPELEEFRVQTLERIDGVDGSYVFDATVRFRLFGMDFLIVVEAKHHTHPIKRELVQILHSKAVSVGAQKAVLIATASLQQGAINSPKRTGLRSSLSPRGASPSRPKLRRSEPRLHVKRPTRSGSLLSLVSALDLPTRGPE